MKGLSLSRRQFGALSIGLGVALSATKAAAEAFPNRKPTNFVLVHGAWYGGWCWSRPEKLLRDRGHNVTAPTCPGLGELKHLMSKDINLSTFITTVTNHIVYENLSEVVLVGSGYSGAVISGVADRIPQALKALVFLDALVLPNGASAFSEQPAAITRKRLEQVEKQGGGIAIPPPPISTYGISDSETEAWVASRLAPTPVGLYTEELRLTNPFGNGVPITYIDCTASAFAPLVEVKKKLKATGAVKWIDFDAHHDPMITEPTQLVDLLLAL